MAEQPRKKENHKTGSTPHAVEETTEQRVQQQPHNPFPAQHQEKPGSEADLTPRPRYRAPLYKGADKLQKKVALITGGDSGIGRAVAVLYAREGADIALLFLPEELADAQETQSAVEAEGRTALLLPGNITDVRFCHEAVQRTVNHFGKLDILVTQS